MAATKTAFQTPILKLELFFEKLFFRQDSEQFNDVKI